MADGTSKTAASASSLAAAISQAQGDGYSGAALEKSPKKGPKDWNPPFCGDIDMRIARDGTWFYLGTPIGRIELVKLFSGVIRREDDAYFLVTPVEKVGIQVDDAPFIAKTVHLKDGPDGPVLHFTTNVDTVVEADADHPIEVWLDADTQEPAPYIHVRDDLWALMARPVFYQLVEWSEELDRPDGETVYVVESHGQVFELGAA